MAKRRTKALRDRGALDMLTTEQVLPLHERLFAPLDRPAKRRLAERARLNGWDRTWDDVALVA